MLISQYFVSLEFKAHIMFYQSLMITHTSNSFQDDARLLEHFNSFYPVVINLSVLNHAKHYCFMQSNIYLDF